jgi:hypothetical protein
MIVFAAVHESAFGTKRTLSSNPVERDLRHNPNVNCDMLSNVLGGDQGSPMRRQELITFLGGVTSR